MRAGRLRYRVTIQAPQVVRDAMGGESITWVTETTVWAELDPYRLAPRVNLMREHGRAVLSFRARAPLAVTLEKRAVYEGAPYRVIEIDGSRRHRGEIAFIVEGEGVEA